MKVKYIKYHNNYDFVLGNIYEAEPFKKGWMGRIGSESLVSI